MAARRRNAYPEDARARINGLIDQLTDHALGAAELSVTQIRAIEVLLKALPALDDPNEHEITVKGALAWSPPSS